MSTSRQLSEWEKTKSSRPSRFFWAEWLGCCGRVEPGQDGLAVVGDDGQ